MNNRRDKEEIRVQDHGYLGPESMTWKIAREAIINIGGARAVLMQLAHPLVAMGVSEHSRYMTDPFGRARDTFMLGQMLVFGSKQTSRQAAHTINLVHKHVHGILPDQAGAYQAGTPYNARDPELLLWVQATLIDTLLLVYPLLIGPLSHEEQERYYQESRQVGRLLGLAEKDMPKTVDELHHYIHTMIYSDRLAATPQARQLAHQVLFPPMPELWRPLLHLHYQLTSALLPQPVREIYGMEWGPKRQRIFEATTTGVHTLLATLPPSLRILPLTHKLMQRGSAA
jgi:uncharacterized protein (DUF2236 family)